MRNRGGLTALSLFGVVLALGLVTSIPVFTRAVSYLMLREELATLGYSAHRAPISVRLYYQTSAAKPLTMAQAQQMQRVATQMLSTNSGLPVLLADTWIQNTMSFHYAPGDPRLGDGPNLDLQQVSVNTAPLVADHITVVDGEPFAKAKRADGRIAVWASEPLADKMGLVQGESYDLWYRAVGRIFPVYIAGFWRATDPSDPYWEQDPTKAFSEALLVPPHAYEDYIQPLLPQGTGFDSWYIVFDDRALTVERAGTVAVGLPLAINRLAVLLPGTKMDYAPLPPLQHYLPRVTSLSALLTGFSVPGLGLLLYFVTMISGVTALFQAEEMSILASRGGGRLFLISLAAVEAAILLIIGTPLGLLAGYGLARLMGYTQSFLVFVSRPPLPTSWVGMDWRPLVITLLMLFGARVLPAWRASRDSIIAHLRERSRPVVVTIVTRLGIDLPLILVSAYAYQRLRQRGTLAVFGWEPTGDPFRDPLLLLAPTLFILTACLLIAHLFPLLIRPLDFLSGRLRSLAGYLGLRQLVRQSGQYTSALFLVCACLGLGAFYASLAQSLDQWLQDRLYYQVGADFALQQVPLAQSSQSNTSSSTSSVASLTGEGLPLASDYERIPGVQAAARVSEFGADAITASHTTIRLLGIDRTDFPQVAYFRPDFSQIPLGELMNRLAAQVDGLLVPHQFMAANGLSQGQSIELETTVASTPYRIPFRIVGTFDYFPTMYPEKELVFVANLDYLSEQIGEVPPYDIWLRTDPTLTAAQIRNRMLAMGVDMGPASDTRELIREDQQRVERIGLFGVLSVGFLAGSILSCVGLLLYTYASLMGRTQQLSVLRAIGMSQGSILATVTVEYLGVIAYGIAGGVAVAVASSRLFVPFFHFATDPTQLAPPFLPEIAWTKIAWIGTVFALTLVLSQWIILSRVARSDIFQALRMGQRQ